MTALTTRQRDILQLLLDAHAPQGTHELALQMQLTPRQVNYGLKGLDRWLARRGVTLKVTPGVGVELTLKPDQIDVIQHELEQETHIQLVLSADQRYQLLAFVLLAADEPVIAYQLQQHLEVSRTTVLKDLDAIEAWLARHDLLLERRPNYGIWIKGTELTRRQALLALLWGEGPFAEPVFGVSHTAGLTFALADDVDLLPIVGQVQKQMAQLEMQRMLSHVAYAEAQLGGRFTDDAVLLLALLFAIETQRTHNGRFAHVDPQQLAWLQALPLWPLAVEMARRLGWRQRKSWPQSEVGALAMYLLATPRNERWPGDLEIDEVFPHLVERLQAHIAAAYALPALAHDRTLHDGLLIQIIPACLRQRFQLRMPTAVVGVNLPEQYAFEQALAQELAEIIAAETAVALPPHEISALVLLLRAAYIRERPAPLHEVVVVCPSGMATAQLLVARLKVRFPRLGNLTVLSMREVGSHKMAAAELIITTAPLPANICARQDVIQVHPLLLPEDIEAITQWLA